MNWILIIIIALLFSAFFKMSVDNLSQFSSLSTL